MPPTTHPMPAALAAARAHRVPARARRRRRSKNLNKAFEAMEDNVRMVQQRGVRLEDLQNKTDDLATSAQGFRRGANQVRKKMWWRHEDEDLDRHRYHSSALHHHHSTSSRRKSNWLLASTTAMMASCTTRPPSALEASATDQRCVRNGTCGFYFGRLLLWVLVFLLICGPVACPRTARRCWDSPRGDEHSRSSL
ncbi:hypothetical protein VTJ83DRAFT_3935 [Remersonia thermophila]|uniref:V-SNARE coiled-coil homology domain-containing protein n=1 Tax=Remersonia thermophila TaxID=72144 RepID=A0ABR4DGB5_9PEZI